MSKAKLHKFIEVKSLNRRISVLWFVDEENSESHSFVVITKRLLDFKKRHITETESHYSPESFMIMADCFNVMIKSPDFKKQMNRIIGQMDKNRGKATTNLTMP
jgi:hypothetical protein